MLLQFTTARIINNGDNVLLQFVIGAFLRNTITANAARHTYTCVLGISWNTEANVQSKLKNDLNFNDMTMFIQQETPS